MITLSIIDDEIEFINFFRAATLELPGVVCVKSKTNIDDYLSAPLPATNKHFLFLDIHLGQENSIERIPEILQKNPDLEIVIYSVDEDYTKLMTALKQGACGYVIKKFDKAYLQEFFQILDKGGAAISPEMARKLIFAVNGGKSGTRLNELLNEKEVKVLSALANGWTYKFIANEMSISIDMVRYYIKKIYKKLNVNSRNQAVRIFQNET